MQPAVAVLIRAARKRPVAPGWVRTFGKTHCVLPGTLNA